LSSNVDCTVQGDFDALSYSNVGRESKIGLGALINVRAVLYDHCILGELVEVGPGAVLMENVQVGEYSRIGAGAVILPGIHLGRQVTIGAGGVVTKNVSDKCTVKGIPANN
jgi:acetyltransferase-like isoleucine patch superfamily enzyme